ncbi:M48 family metallopeptidase [Gottfriedia solisilvae]|uniref:YgjP-like metallopeptidase domain-containing protein n=1 Tax=Gottfriedia solisilvae TaxID=1516104 RepID=A0A8J3EV03_9BACI|nr:SprT family zinc-dependent metalloprotease [Gottfriedia solisilvae]GGI12575.1 hypothetical protein GCM10007380_13600 [Gottfriedia solisilvae]
MPEIQFGNTTIEYTLNIVKNDGQFPSDEISIVVEWLDGVTVTTTDRLTINEIESMLYKKAKWILDKWEAVNEIVEAPPHREFISGEKLPYCGKNYKIKVLQNNKLNSISINFLQGKFLIETPFNPKTTEHNEQVKERIIKWYITHAQSKAIDRANYYSQLMGVTPKSIKVKTQHMRWGTCTPSGNIYLNWRLFMAPISVIDYVIVHELAHLKYPNHSKDYWSFVQTILPNYEEKKDWLRKNGPLLTL